MLWWGFETLLAVILGSIFFDRVLMPRVVRHGQDVVVPAVAGLSLEQAETLLTSAGLRPVQSEGKYSDLVPGGLVLEASPAAGLAVKKGRQVFITPSLGLENRQVPDLQGLSLRLASVRLRESGLAGGNVDYAATDRVQPGEVIATNPPAGAPVPTAGTVALLLSRKKTAIPFWMPDLTGRPAVEAAAWLEACGFSARMQESAFPGEPGTVLSQFPPGGSPIWPGTEVRLTVVRAPLDFPDFDEGSRGGRRR